MAPLDLFKECTHTSKWQKQIQNEVLKRRYPKLQIIIWNFFELRKLQVNIVFFFKLFWKESLDGTGEDLLDRKQILWLSINLTGDIRNL